MICIYVQSYVVNSWMIYAILFRYQHLITCWLILDAILFLLIGFYYKIVTYSLFSYPLFGKDKKIYLNLVITIVRER